MDQTEWKILKFRYFQFCRILNQFFFFFGSQNVRNGPPKHFIASYCIFVSQKCNKMLMMMMAIFCSSENHTKISVISVFTHFGWVQVGIENSILKSIMLHPYMCYCIAHVAFAFRSGVEGFNFTFKKRWWHGALYLSSSDNLQCVVMFRNG